MINEQHAHLFCKEDISKIENYYKAIADTTQTWHLHHRTEIWWNCSKKELIENECYFNRKACELIFLTPSEHSRLHNTGENNPRYGTRLSDEQRIQRRTHKDITVSQLEDRKTYMREYQRIYRAQHPDYYRNLYRERKVLENRG